jgi:phosphoribosyl-AMP cyclohydrolase
MSQLLDKPELEEGSTLHLDFSKLKQVGTVPEDVIPVVVQDAKTKEVLIVCYVNRLAIETSLETNMATFWSTSRNELWVKGATSGDSLRVEEIRVNCEQNSVLYLVTPLGHGACHTKSGDHRYRKSCYYRRITEVGQLEFSE